MISERGKQRGKCRIHTTVPPLPLKAFSSFSPGGFSLSRNQWAEQQKCEFRTSKAGKTRRAKSLRGENHRELR